MAPGSVMHLAQTQEAERSADRSPAMACFEPKQRNPAKKTSLCCTACCARGHVLVECHAGEVANGMRPTCRTCEAAFSQPPCTWSLIFVQIASGFGTCTSAAPCLRGDMQQEKAYSSPAIMACTTLRAVKEAVRRQEHSGREDAGVSMDLGQAAPPGGCCAGPADARHGSCQATPQLLAGLLDCCTGGL